MQSGDDRGQCEWTGSGELAKLERVIAANRDRPDGFALGRALIAIKELNLFPRSGGGFAGYLVDRWDFKRAYAYQLISAARCEKILAAAGPFPPKSARQVRLLVGLTPRQMVRAWRSACHAAGGRQPNPEEIRAAVEREGSR